MKKLALLAIMALAFISCESQERVAVEFNQLPAEAQSFVKTHFSDKTISIIFHDKDLFDKDYEVMFVTGKNYYDEYKNNKYTNNIKIVPFVDDMVRLLPKADCLVSRAGASTLSEITALNVLTFFINIPPKRLSILPIISFLVNI